MNSSGRCRARPSAATSACASTIGARRLTSSARSISCTRSDSSAPDAGSAALATRMSTSPASPTRRCDLGGLGEVDRQRAGAQLGGRAARARRRGGPSGSASRRARRARARSPGRCPRSRRSAALSSRRSASPSLVSLMRAWQALRDRAAILPGARTGPRRADHRAVRPTGSARPRRDRARPLLRARGEDPVAVSADALQVYAGLETLTGVAERGRAGAARAPAGLVPAASTRRSASASTRELAHAEIDGLLGERAPADRRRRHGPVPARGADRARPAPGAARGRARALDGASSNESGRRRCTRGWRERAPWAAEDDRPERPPAGRARAGAARSWASSSRREGPSQLWSEELRHPTLLGGLTMEREALYARDRRAASMRWSRPGAREEVLRARTPPASRRRPARRSASTSCWRATSSDEAAHAQLRAPPADLDAQARGRARDRRHRARPGGRRGARS